MGYTAKLIKGLTYDVHGKVLRKDEEIPVSKELHDYLQDNKHFEVKANVSSEKLKEQKTTEKDQGEGKGKIEPPYTEALTEDELKKMQKDELESIIVGFDGDVASVKNNEERVALILKLQTEAGL
ncbi:YqbF domain-containing protein [Terribacillus saccharophilus]|uniref:YqbF domain-containing protein n=1 Tax=Terribacillus saccharophilus TaxID=361277 RepID=UPI003D2B7BF1